MEIEENERTRTAFERLGTAGTDAHASSRTRVLLSPEVGDAVKSAVGGTLSWARPLGLTLTTARTATNTAYLFMAHPRLMR